MGANLVNTGRVGKFNFSRVTSDIIFILVIRLSNLF